MAELPAWAIAFFLVASACLQIPCGLLLDQLLRYQYRFHPDLWDEDGRPSGFLWCPKDAEWFLTEMQPYPAHLRWLWRTPDWIRNEPRCHEKLKVVRVIEAFSIILAAAWLVCLFAL